MPLEMPQADIPRLKAMLDVAEENLRALEWFSGYLNLCPRFVRGEDVEMLVRECGVTGEEAYRLLMASACGLDIAADPWACAAWMPRPAAPTRTMPPCVCPK